MNHNKDNLPKKDVGNDIPVSAAKKKRNRKLIISMTAVVLLAVLVTTITLLALGLAKKEYTVSFLTNGGNEISDVVVDQDGTLALPANPVREGYIFEGWYIKENKKWNDSKVSEDMTLFAKWNVTITIDNNNGEDNTTITVLENDKMTALATPSNAGYVFDGWYAGDAKWDFNNPVQNSMTLKANWWDHKITFNSNGGNTIDVQGVDNGGKITIPNNPRYPERIFDGWYYKGVKWTFETDVVTESMELVAKWNVRVTFGGESLSGIPEQVLEQGGIATRPLIDHDKNPSTPMQDPTREGYIFEGWFLNSVEWDFSKQVFSNTKLVAKWTKIHTIAFKSEGVADETAKVNDGDKIIKPTEPIREGYTFAGWYVADGVEDKFWDFENGIPTEDMILTAKWEVIVIVS